MFTIKPEKNNIMDLTEVRIPTEVQQNMATGKRGQEVKGENKILHPKKVIVYFCSKSECFNKKITFNFILTCQMLNISRFIFQLILPSFQYHHSSFLKKYMYSQFQLINVFQLKYNKQQPDFQSNKMQKEQTKNSFQYLVRTKVLQTEKYIWSHWNFSVSFVRLKNTN